MDLRRGRKSLELFSFKLKDEKTTGKHNGFFSHKKQGFSAVCVVPPHVD